MLFYFIAFYRPGSLYGASKKQQFLCKGGFTRIGVADYGKSAPSRNFVLILHAINKCILFYTALYYRRQKYNNRAKQCFLVMCSRHSSFVEWFIAKRWPRLNL